MDLKPFQILQLNAQKRIGVMHNVINDESLKGFGALLIQEPHVWKNNEGKETIASSIYLDTTAVKLLFFVIPLHFFLKIAKACSPSHFSFSFATLTRTFCGIRAYE